MEKELDLTLRIDNGNYEIDFYEPESGDIRRAVFAPVIGPSDDFNTMVGEEVFSWFSMMQEELDYQEKEAI